MQESPEVELLSLAAIKISKGNNADAITKYVSIIVSILR